MNDLATRPPADLAPARAAPNPLRMVPKEWRECVSFFWLMNQHLLPAVTPLAARLKVYHADGLTLDDLRAILRQLASPRRQANHKFAADLLADLAELVGLALASRAAGPTFDQRCEAAKVIPLPERIDTPEVRAAWVEWVERNRAAGRFARVLLDPEIRLAQLGRHAPEAAAATLSDPRY